MLHANSLNLEESKNGMFGKGSSLSQTKSERLFQSERVCRRQFQIFNPLPEDKF